MFTNTSTPEAIDGFGTMGLTISGNGTSGVIVVKNGRDTEHQRNHGHSSGLATSGGGGIDNSGTLNVINSTITGNVSTGGGGGIDNEPTGTLDRFGHDVLGQHRHDRRRPAQPGDGTAQTLTNVTIAGNTATTGGGIGNTGTLVLMNDTIASNSATSEIGGGLFDDQRHGNAV